MYHLIFVLIGLAMNNRTKRLQVCLFEFKR